MSPRRTAIVAASAAMALHPPGLRQTVAAAEPVIDRGSLPFGHFGCQLLVFLDGQRGLVQGIIVTAIVGGQRLFQQPLNELRI